jgi:hypothetical protein
MTARAMTVDELARQLRARWLAAGNPREAVRAGHVAAGLYGIHVGHAQNESRRDCPYCSRWRGWDERE